MILIHYKADGCHIFKRTLIESDGKRLVESTQHIGYSDWAGGLFSRDTVSTRPSYHPGSNHLGRILEQIRSELPRAASHLQKIDTDRPDDVTSSAAGDPAVKSTTTSDLVPLESKGISSDASTSVIPIAQDDPGIQLPQQYLMTQIMSVKD